LIDIIIGSEEREREREREREKERETGRGFVKNEI